MAQINLLSNETKGKALPVKQLLSFFVWIFALLFFVVILYYGYLWYSSKNAATTILSKQTSIIKMQDEVLSHKDRREFLARQTQVKELEKLMGTHPYWSKLFPELARVTLKSAYYTALSATDKGEAKMTVIVPDYAAFNNYLEVFNLDEFNKQFSSVVVGGVSKYQVAGASGVKFDIELSYNTEFLKKQASSISK